MSKKVPVYLTSPAPLDDGGRKYNIIYLAAAGICGIAGLATGGFSGLILGVVVGLFIGFVIKASVIKFKWYGLREMKFAMGHPVEKNLMFQRLVEKLTLMGMVVELHTDGTPVITYQSVIYEISLNEDQTFTIWWRKSLARAIFSIDLFTIIPNYRKAVVAMGMIAYYIQQLSMEQLPSNSEKEELPSAKPSRQMPPTDQVPQPQGNPAMTVLNHSEKKKFPVQAVGIGAAAVIVLGVGMVILSGSEETAETKAPTLAETEEQTDIQTTAQTAAQSEPVYIEESQGSQKVEIGAYDLYAALQENDLFTYTLNDKMTEFLQTYEDLFPASSVDDVMAAGVVDASLEARQIMKNPSRYGDRLMFLPELQVVQIIESEVDTDQYITEINVADLQGQFYYIIYNGVLDDVFVDDWISAYGLPLGATTYENTAGGETWTIPMAGSYVEKLEEDLSMIQPAEEIIPITEGEYINYDSGVWIYVYYYSDDGTLMAQFNVPGEISTYFEVHEIGAEGAFHRFEDEYGGTYLFTVIDGGLNIYAESESTMVDGFYELTQDYSNAG